MPFIPKDWKDEPDHTTPLSAAALENLETRLSDYTDDEVATRQPSDADLTALAALTTTAYGRSLLEVANAAAARTLIDALRDEAGAVTDTHLASPNNAAYKTMVDWRPGVLSDTLAASTLVFLTTSMIAPASNGSGPAVFYLNPADYAVAGLATKYRLRALWSTNAQAAPAITCTFGLYPVASTIGGADAITLTLDTVVAGSTAEIVTPAISTQPYQTSADFTAPAAGPYALGVVLSGAPAADSRGQLAVSLQARNT